MIVPLYRKLLGEVQKPADCQFISPPRVQLLVRLGLLWLWLAASMIMAFNFLLLIAIPLQLCMLYMYWHFFRRWRSHGYSARLLHVATAVVWLGTAVAADPIRRAIHHLLVG